MGYGIIDSGKEGVRLLAAGVLKLEKYSSQALRLKRIFEKMLALIDEYHPDELAVEAPFFGKNVQSMLKLGRAQGVALAAALYREVPVTEYSPKKVKQSVTGNGNSSKEQVAAMLQHLLGFREMPKYLDATDALAVALCHSMQHSPAGKTGGKAYSGWGSFVAENPGRQV